MCLDEDDIRVRRNKIIEIAFQLFCKYGIEQVSMGQIEEQSGVGERAIYRYFDNKTSLVVDVLIHQWEMLVNGIRENIGFDTTNSVLTGHEQMNFFTHGIRGPCIAALEKGRADGMTITCNTFRDLYGVKNNL